MSRLLLLLLLPALLFAAPPDEEAALAANTPVEGAFGRIRERYYLQRITPAQAVGEYRQLIRRAPGTWWAARAESEMLGILAKEQQWAAYVPDAAGFLARYPAFASLHYGPLLHLANITGNERLPPELRAAALVALAPRVGSHAEVLARTRRWLLAQPPPPPAAELVLDEQPAGEPAVARWALAAQLVATAGSPTGGERFLAPFLLDALPKLPAAAALAQADAFLAAWPATSPEARPVYLWQLRQRDLAAWQQDQAAERTARQAFDAELAQVRAAFAAGDHAAALAVLRTWRERPVWQRENAWQPLAEKDAAALAPAPLLDLLDEAFTQLAAGRAIQDLGKLYSDREFLFAGDLLPRSQALAGRYFATLREDRGRLAFALARWVRLVERDHPPEAQLGAISLAAEAAGAAGLADLQADYRFRRAELAWDLDRDQALADLRACLTLCPGSPVVPKAAWLLAALTGERAIVQDLQPRVQDDAFAEPPPVAPWPAELSVPAPPAVAVAADGTWSLAPQETAPLALLPAPWTPAEWPASRLLPLPRVTTLTSLTLTASARVQVVVSLLGAEGRVLFRAERAWPLWDALGDSGYFAGPELTLHFLPVGEVAAVRVDLLGADLADATLLAVTAQPAPFPATALHLGEPQPLPTRDGTGLVYWSADEPERTQRHTARGENVQGWPLMRWRSPWPRHSSPLSLREAGDHLSVAFHGHAATLHLADSGTVTWQLGDQRGRHAGPAPLALPVPPPATAPHLLRLAADSPDRVSFVALEVTGRATAQPLIRFGDGARWQAWQELPGAGAPVWWREASHYQLAARFDSRAAGAAVSATLRELRLEPGAAHVPLWLPPPRPPEPLVAVAARLARGELAVVYSKQGTAAEHAAAQRLARHAGAYLVSDDVGLNDYPGPYLVVGTPLTSRMDRQLLAREALWLDADYLNDPRGRVGETDGFAYVTGETPAAVVAAAERLLAATSAPPPPATPLSLFPVDLWERVYPWQMHPERPAPERLTVRLGQGDRRSATVGVRLHQPLTAWSANCSPLRQAGGNATLPAPRLRLVAGYEWIPFFGGLRLPELLVEQPPLPLAAPAATALWFTVATAADTPPGRYEGTLTLTANGQPTALPVVVEVLPVAFPPAPFTWYSYASVPYWYHAGSPAWRAAFTALMRNEAEHGATMVSIAPAITCQGDPPTFDFTLVDWQLDTADALFRAAGRPPPRYYQYAPRNLPPSADAHYQRAYAEALTPRLRAAARWARFYLKVGDEPGDIVAWGKLAEPYRAGGLQTTTAHATRYDLAPVVGTMTAWCPNYEHDLELPLLRERQAAGDPFWWYICTVPSTRITGQPVDTLPFYWLTALWRLDGGHSYAGLSPPDGGPEGTGVPFRYDHGLAWRILFLPDGTLLDSTRREYEAEAIRDAELLRLAGERGAALAAPLLPGKYSYSRDTAAWSAVRQQLYDLLLTAPPR